MDAGGSVEGDFYKLPEGCISHILSLTSPRDACRSAATSSAFRSAAASDMVWERFLPSDYQSIVDRSVDPVGTFPTRKELYFRLCQPILFDGGLMSFSLEKESGKKCYMLSARKLEIVWGSTPGYWSWIPSPDSRFSEYALLEQVCWLEIHGAIASSALSPRTTYGTYLVFKLSERSHGLIRPPQRTSVRIGGHVVERHVRLQPAALPQPGQLIPVVTLYRGLARWLMPVGGVFRFPQEVEHNDAFLAATAPEHGSAPVSLTDPQSRADGWMEIELGQFFNECGDVDMRLMQVKGGNWKKGLIIEGMEVRPK